MTFVDDLGGILLVLSLTREGELVLGLAIGDLVDPVEQLRWVFNRKKKRVRGPT